MERGVDIVTAKSKLELRLQRDSEQNLLSGVGPGVGFEFIKAYFPKAQNTIKIASAYFSLKGYKIGKDFISPKTQLEILVGREEGINVQKTLIEEIAADVNNCEEDLQDAILDLIQRIENGFFVIKDARELQVKFHSKFYICDNKYIWHGSANYTGNGLKQNAEQISVSSNLEQIELFSDWYDNALRDARDILSELLGKLHSLTKLASPFDVYLKALLLLNSSPNLERRPNANVPTYYQKGVIANAVNQANKFGGGMIVAATGLGKTVIGSEIALNLISSEKIKRVILIAPNGVMENWEDAFESLDINPKYFNTMTAFQKPSKGEFKVKELDIALKNADQKTLIIIDEAHFYRNQLLSEKIKEQKSEVYKRLLPAIKAGARIFLLTATVYGTNYQNLNSLLFLLPHRKTDTSKNLIPWEAKNIEEFMRLPVVTILGLPHVLKMAKNKGDIDENGRVFIQIADKRNYLPEKIKLYSVSYELFLREEIENAFEARCFDQSKKIPQSWFDDKTFTLREGVTDAGRKTSVESWLSSPVAMAENINSNFLIDKGKTLSNLPFDKESSDFQNTPKSKKDLMRLNLNERRKILQPIADVLPTLSEDDKLVKLKNIIKKHCIETKGKVIVFVNRHFTALHVFNFLEHSFGDEIKVGCTIEISEGGTRLRKNRDETLKRFSPHSHNVEISDEDYNVLICTDADGVGINLQDANTVVNYDPPESADLLFQRAGRVLRMTEDPNRTVHFYTLIPSVVNDFDSNVSVHKDIKDIFMRIAYRHDISKNILGSKVISDDDYFEIKLDDQEIDIESFDQNASFLKSIGGHGVESMLHHTWVLEQNRPRAENLPEYIFSARTYSDVTPYMFVLIEYEGKNIPVLYDLEHEYFEREETLKILDLISCTESASHPFIKASDVEHYANRTVQNWCRLQKIPISNVRKICALYLQPEKEAKDIKSFLNS